MRSYSQIPFTKEFTVAPGNYGSTRLPIKGVTIHSIVGSVQSAASRFATPGQFASCNYIIGEDGRLYRVLEEYYVPYTNGVMRSNQESITIEHADYGKPYDPRPAVLYAMSAKLVSDICREYKLPINRTTVKGHREIPGSSTACPAGLDIDRIVREAKALVAPSPTPQPINLNWTDAQKKEVVNLVQKGTGNVSKYKFRDILNIPYIK